jgi:hypothetical protein
MNGEDAEEPIEPPRKWPDGAVPSWLASRDFVEIMLPLDSGSSLGRFASATCPCLALKSARYAIYSLYSSVLRYTDSWMLYFSLAALAWASNGSLPVGSNFCHRSPTSLAICVNERFWSFTSSLILLENIT